MTPEHLDTLADQLQSHVTELRSMAAKLRGELPPPPKERKKAPPSSLYDTSIKAFGEIWHARYKQKYIPSPADRAQLGRLLNILGPESASLPGLFMAYLADGEDFVVRQGHSLKYFCASFNRYRARRTSDPRPLL